MARNVETLVANVEDLYETILYDNIKTLDILRNGTEEEIKLHFKQIREEKDSTLPYYDYALEKLNLIGTRFYIQDVDITSAMREVIYKEEYKSDDELWKVYLEGIKNYEDECFKDYLRCILGQAPEGDRDYANYIKLAKEVNEFIGSFDSDVPYFENPQEFRELVKKLIEARKNCMLVVCFTKKVISKEYKNKLNARMTYEEALDIARDIIDNIANISYGDKSLVVDETIDNLYNEHPKQRSKIMEKFITNFLNQAGVDRRLYTKYMKYPLYLPNKKLALAIGLFCEPYADLEDKESTELAIVENLERFMNQNSLSLHSYFATITEYDSLSDEEFLGFVQDGLSLDVLAYILKHYARTEKDFPKK